MTKTKRYFALLLVLTMCLTTFAGCGKKNNDTTNTNPTIAPSATPSVQEDAVGSISYVGDASIAISEYTAEHELTDFASLDTSALTATDSTRYIPVDNNTEYYIAAGDSLTAASKADLAVGDFITVTTSDNGVLRIIRLEANTNDNNTLDNNNNSDSGTAGNTTDNNSTDNNSAVEGKTVDGTTKSPAT